MKLLMMSPHGLPPDDAVALADETDGPPKHVLSFPVPGPEVPGEFVFLTVTPDGQPACVIADAVRNDGVGVEALRRVPGSFNAATEQWDYTVETKIPKEAPWMLLRRSLMRYQTQEEIQRNRRERFGLVGLPSLQCPVHGSNEPTEPRGEAEAKETPTGQYL